MIVRQTSASRSRLASFAFCLLVAALLVQEGVAQTPPARIVASSLATDLPSPKLLWQRDIALPVPAERNDERPAPLANVLTLATSADGGALIVGRQTDGHLRLLAFDASGKEIYARQLSDPPDVPASGFITLIAAIEASAPGPVWLFQTWRHYKPGEDNYGPDFSRLLALDKDGREVGAIRLADGVGGRRDFTAQRLARVMRRMPDGSLLAGGTAYAGPPYWWYARFTVRGRLLHEQMSSRFPDYVEDAYINPDGGFTLLMVDAEGGSEKVTMRRYGPDGRLGERHRFADLPQSIGCAVLVASLQQIRAIGEPGKDGETARSDLVWHEPGRGIIARLDIGKRGCESLKRNGKTVLLTASTLPIVDDAPSSFIAIIDGKPRWLHAETELAIGTPTADGGLLLLRVVKRDGRPQMQLARYGMP